MTSAALFTLGDEEVEEADLHEIAQYLLNPAHHQSAAALAALNSGLPSETRARYCGAVVSYLLARLEPLCTEEETPNQTTVRFMRECKPYLMTRWAKHMQVYRTPRGKPQAVYASAYLRAVLIAAEELFSVPGHLVAREQ